MRGNLDRHIKPKTHFGSKYPYVLAIIDMQGHFDAANNTFTIQNVLNLIKHAKKFEAYIIIAQFKSAGPTLKIITDAVKFYPFKSYVTANENDKSKAIFRKLRAQGIHAHTMKICGVNTCYCVYSTIAGLVKLKSFLVNIKLIKNACNCSSYHSSCLYHFTHWIDTNQMSIL
jgi:hypothetical protein